jgi:long-chain acyl-CoA synthetase
MIAMQYSGMTTTAFAGTFRSYVPVTLTSDRSGLVMETGAKVELRGVQVGRVSQIGDGKSMAGLRLEIDPDQIRYIPANVQAQISATSAFALSVLPLLGAASTVVMRHHFDPAETLELIDRYQVTNIHLVPTQFIRLLKLPDDVRASFDGGSLVSVVHGAAPCPVAVKQKMLDWWGPVITEYYGGTEGGFLTIVTGEEWQARPGTLGRPTNMTELMIVGEDGVLCAAGQSGQIYFKSLIGGDFTYHNAPEKTEAAHMAPGVGTLGDVGYLDDEGYLFMSDRKIDMIISGGVNIYPAEIEGVLVGHPAVADAAVFGIPDDEMGEQVKAAVELTAGMTASDELAAELMAYARQHLAGYKAPRTIDFEEQLPRQPTGKIYKRLLRDPYWEGSGRTI